MAAKRASKCSQVSTEGCTAKKKRTDVEQSDFLQSKPTEIDIRTHVCQKAGDKWPAVCTYLGVPDPKIQMARGNNPNQEEDACFEAVMHWRSGNTSVVVSWAGLLEALKRAGLGGVVDSIAVQNGLEPLEVCSILSKSLQHARGLAYNTYKQDLTEGMHKLQFTKVAILQNDPQPRQKGDMDDSEILKRYRDCGERLSEGATELVTVNDFLHKGPCRIRVIYGQPGTGKTTFLKHLCQKVASDEPSDFSLVLFFPLRDKAVAQALKKPTPYVNGLNQLLQYYISDETYSDIVQEMLQFQGKGLLIIFDGADEVRGLMDYTDGDGSLLAAVFESRLLPQAHIIVSTRPGACPLLQGHSTSFYVILGFDEESVELYIEAFFESEPGKGKAMLSDLRARPDLMGGAYIPVNLHIFCSIYEHGIAGRSAFPPTMTECYKSSIAKTITREKQKVKRSSRIDPSLIKVPDDIVELLRNLGELAFGGLTQKVPNYIFQEDEVRHVFSATIKPDEILEDSCFRGLLHLHPDQDGYSSTLNFSHTTRQEYFAAYHLSLLPEADQVTFWRENHHNPKFAVVLKFFAGLTQFKSSAISAIFTSATDLPSHCNYDNPHLFLVFHTLFESQNESLTQSIVTQLDSCLTFDLYLTPFDTMVLSHCLTKCKQLTELRLRHPVPPTSFHHVCSVVQSIPQLQSLALRVDWFSPQNARELCEAAASLKKLELTVEQGSNPLSTSEALAVVFDHRSLEELDLIPFSTVELADSRVLQEKVAHCHLRELRLTADKTQLPLILNAVKDNCSIEDLAVADPTLGDHTPRAVVSCVQAMPQLRTLYLRWIDPLPVFQALVHRDVPLNSVEVCTPQWPRPRNDTSHEQAAQPNLDFNNTSNNTRQQLCMRTDEERSSEVYWGQLEEAASCAKVMKVKMDKKYSSRASIVLDAGFSKNPLLPEIGIHAVQNQIEGQDRS